MAARFGYAGLAMFVAALGAALTFIAAWCWFVALDVVWPYSMSLIGIALTVTFAALGVFCIAVAAYLQGLPARAETEEE